MESRSSTLHGFMAAETNNDYCGYLHTLHIRAEKSDGHVRTVHVKKCDER